MWQPINSSCAKFEFAHAFACANSHFHTLRRACGKVTEHARTNNSLTFIIPVAERAGMIRSHMLSCLSTRLSQNVEGWWFARAGACTGSNFAQIDRKNSMR